MKLINGKGQLGENLSKRGVWVEGVHVYHTWNFLDISYDTQKKEYEKFLHYLSGVSDKIKVVFISTSSKKQNWYNHFKKLGENKILSESKDNLVIRLPCIAGKGVFVGFRDRIIKPHGVVNFLTIKECVDFIINSIDKSGIVQADGWDISAESLCELVKFFQDTKDNI